MQDGRGQRLRVRPATQDGLQYGAAQERLNVVSLARCLVNDALQRNWRHGGRGAAEFEVRQMLPQSFRELLHRAGQPETDRNAGGIRGEAEDVEGYVAVLESPAGGGTRDHRRGKSRFVG
jgi:hypothetical protein